MSQRERAGTIRPWQMFSRRVTAGAQVEMRYVPLFSREPEALARDAIRKALACAFWCCANPEHQMDASTSAFASQGGRSSPSPEGAKCNSLGQRPRNPIAPTVFSLQP